MSALAEIVRNFICANTSATLSSISLSHQAYPFGSLTPYALDHEGNPIIYISLIAEHYKNLCADPRASLCVQDPFGLYDPQAHARATLIGRFETAAQEAAAVLEEIYRKRFPHSEGFQLSHNFVFMRMQVERVRWIGGFGEIAWVSAKDYAAAKLDPLSADAFAIAAHMNQDHHDALLELVRANDAANAKVKHACVCAVESSGMQLRFWIDGEEREVKLEFEAPAATPEQVRSAMIGLLKRARAA